MDLGRAIYIPQTECGLALKMRMALGKTYSTDRVWASQKARGPEI